MKIPFLAISIWMFIFMTVLGVFGYAYVLWSQYWHSAQEQKHSLWKTSKDKSFSLHATKNVNKIPSDFGRSNISGDIPLDKLNHKIHTYKAQLLIQLRKAQLMAGNVLFQKAKKDRNIYKVKFKRQNIRLPVKSRQELICELKQKVNVDMLKKNMEPFKKLGYDKYFPTQSISSTLGKHKTCAIVSSAGSMYKSRLGKEIDSHDIVLRFNNAPTEEYQEDVGTKTSIRFLNSQVVTKPEFDFLNSEMYQNITLIVWDPSKYHDSLEGWYNNPDFDLFPSYWLHRQIYPDQPFYVLHPDVLWSAWDFIQTNTQVPVEPNPPSSGFLGILLLLQFCDTLDVYEYVPSMRLTKRCHYYDVHEDIGCTLGDWHPLASEKLIAMSINEGTDTDIFVTGKIVVSGFTKQNC